MIIPYKADLDLQKIPFVTLLIIIVCVYIYFLQEQNETKFVEQTQQYCSDANARDFRYALKHMTELSSCTQFMLKVRLSKQRERIAIKELVRESVSKAAQPILGGEAYIYDILTKHYQHYRSQVPLEYLTDKLKYVPDSWNTLTMISSVFTHGSWGHVIGNLFFFLAFAATLEIMLGPLWFIFVVLALAVGTNTVYSISALYQTNPLPTVGLSGVVMGMMGLFVYFLPRTNIRVFVWLIIFYKRLSIPAWALVGTYFMLDMYQLAKGDMQGVNLIAHVSGAMIGFLIGVTMFREKKRKLKILMRQHNAPR